jgi:mercuric ion binding protein
MMRRSVIVLAVLMLPPMLVAGRVITAGPPAVASAASAAAAQATVILALDNLTCALCAVTVRRAIGRVDGVSDVTVDLARRSATVRFDPARTTVAAIAAASRNAGFPAEPTS